MDITALCQEQANVDSLIHAPRDGMAKTSQQMKAITSQQEEAEALQKACCERYEEFSDLFKPELGCLKDYEMYKKPGTKLIYCEPQTILLALLDNLNQAYEAAIEKGYWYLPNSTNIGHLWYQSTKHLHQDKRRPSFVSGDYLVTVNHQLKMHQYPIPSPDDLMQRLSDGYYFTKIDLADAYNQVKLSPES